LAKEEETLALVSLKRLSPKVLVKVAKVRKEAMELDKRAY
jgi:hypothetical protein